jgi:hypothetical protein
VSGQVLFERRKRNGAVVRVEIANYKGRPFLNIREWAERGGELLPTRKGVTVPLDAMRDLGKALLAASAEKDSSGRPGASYGHR